MTSCSSVGVIGLGLLGAALSQRLMESGFDVTGFDIDQVARNRLLENGGKVTGSIEELVKNHNVIIFSLPDSNISQKISAEVLACATLPQIVIDTTTGEPSQIKQIAENFADKKVQYIDATVGGSSEQVKTGNVILMIGGDESVVDSCEDIWNCWSENYFHLGPAGSGTRMKLVMNLILGLNRAVLAEGLSFAKSLGIPSETALGILEKSPAFSQVMKTKGEKMIKENFQPQAKLAQHWKDVKLIRDLAEANDLNTPLTSLHESILNQLCNEGFGELDNSVVIKYFS